MITAIVQWLCRSVVQEWKILKIKTKWNQLKIPFMRITCMWVDVHPLLFHIQFVVHRHFARSIVDTMGVNDVKMSVNVISYKGVTIRIEDQVKLNCVKCTVGVVKLESKRNQSSFDVQVIASIQSSLIELGILCDFYQCGFSHIHMCISVQCELMISPRMYFDICRWRDIHLFSDALVDGSLIIIL